MIKLVKKKVVFCSLLVALIIVASAGMQINDKNIINASKFSEEKVKEKKSEEDYEEENCMEDCEEDFEEENYIEDYSLQAVSLKYDAYVENYGKTKIQITNLKTNKSETINAVDELQMGN